MKSRLTNLARLAAALMICGVSITASAEIVYQRVDFSLPFNGYYSMDLDGDGNNEFYLRTWFPGDGVCYGSFGTEYSWIFYVIPTGQNAVVSIESAQVFYAVALRENVLVDGTQFFSSEAPVIGEAYWGTCGRGELGQWFGLPDRYLGLQFRAADGSTHYGWAKISTTVEFLGQFGINTTAFVSGFAYETIPNQGILTGQTSGE